MYIQISNHKRLSIVWKVDMPNKDCKRRKEQLLAVFFLKVHSGTDPIVHFFAHFFVWYIIILYLCLQKQKTKREERNGDLPRDDARHQSPGHLRGQR